MKSNVFYTIIAVLAACMAALSAVYTTGARHSSGEAAHSAVAFVDFSVIMRESEAGKSINAQANARHQVLQNQAQEKLKQFKEQQDDIKKHQSSMSTSEYDAKGKELQGKINDWNNYAQQQQAALNNGVTVAVKNLTAVLRDQLTALGEKNDFSAVLSTDQAFFVQKKLDITAEAVRKLNEHLPKVEVKLENKDESKGKSEGTPEKDQ